MFAGWLETFVSAFHIEDCCCCLPHQKGVEVIGSVIGVLSIVSLVGCIFWTLSIQGACYSPIFTPPASECRKNLNATTEFHAELITISEFMNQYKPNYETFLITMIVLHALTVLANVMLILGALCRNRFCLIPWLIANKFYTVVLISLAIAIIFLEARLFSVGTTVVGLFSILFLFIAANLFYFLVIVQALYLKYEARDLEVKRRTNDAFEGHVNRGFRHSVGCKDQNDPYEIIITNTSEGVFPGEIPLQHKNESRTYSKSNDLTVEPLEVSRL